MSLSSFGDAAILAAYFAVLSVLAFYGIHRYQLIYLYFRHRNRETRQLGNAATHQPGKVSRLTTGLAQEFRARYVVSETEAVHTGCADTPVRILGHDGNSRSNAPATHASQTAWRADAWPRVTVQLPIYNERYVVDRLIEAVCALDYPRDRLQIQVLDDSTDDTSLLAQRCVSRQSDCGIDIVHVRRKGREGFKAGALQDGLRTATGEYIAVFDADFVPAADTLQRLLPHFSSPRIGMVQARWGHLNESYSLLTRAQAILLDGHFVVETGARHRSGRFFNFNGTAGIWRRAAIDDAGGWQHDTLTEDLDLSYRAQLRGWRFVFVPDCVVPAELPIDVNALKTQQYRWAKGSMQTARKLLGRILSQDLPWRIKLEAFYHLTANVCYPLMVLLSVLLLPALLIRLRQPSVALLLLDIPLFAAATLSVGSFYVVALREIHADWRARLVYLPVVLAMGIGLSVNNSRAVVEGLFGVHSDFVRTPKYSIRGRAGGRRNKVYRTRSGLSPWIELSLGLYFAVAVRSAIQAGHLAALPFLLLFLTGFLFVGIRSLLQNLSSHSESPLYH